MLDHPKRPPAVARNPPRLFLQTKEKLKFETKNAQICMPRKFWDSLDMQDKRLPIQVLRIPTFQVSHRKYYLKVCGAGSSTIEILLV